MYGKELILDLHECDPLRFTEGDIELFIIALCRAIDMERAFHPDGTPMRLLWKEHSPDLPDHLVGTSVTQFIRTSTITIHTLDKLGKVFLNVFSCKDFDPKRVVLMAKLWFSGTVVNDTVVERD